MGKSIKFKKLFYQETAVEKMCDFLVAKATADLAQKKFKLQAPTGCGKTYIISKTIEKAVGGYKSLNKKVTFIFIAPSIGKLDYQGYEKMTKYLSAGYVKGFDTNYIGTKGAKVKTSYLQNIDYFKENNVYFLGWSMFGKNANITNMNSEKNDIFKVINNTKKRGIDFVLIIDEAHRDITTKTTSTELIKHIAIKAMNPIKELHMSATLGVNKSSKYAFKVSVADVRKEEAIKKNIIINFGKGDIAEDFSNEFDDENEISRMVKLARKKQLEIKNIYGKKNINMNPLILIQIPDKKRTKNNISIDDYYLSKVEKALNACGLKEKFSYAIWMNDKKTTKDQSEITDNKSKFEVLVFKQAIATGWDIPRANILIRLREPVSSKFDIQTLGRILRNPLMKYYNNDLVDNAYVFTYDKKYYNKIEKEGFCKNIEYKSFPLSNRGKYYQSKKLNLVCIKNIFKIKDEDIILKTISKLKQDDFFHFLV